MLPLMHQNARIPLQAFPLRAVWRTEPCPPTPQERMQLAQRLGRAAAQPAAPMLRIPVRRAHEGEAFGKPALAPARAQRAVPLGHKGWRTPSVVRLGGTRLRMAPSALREDRRGRRAF